MWVNLELPTPDGMGVDVFGLFKVKGVVWYARTIGHLDTDGIIRIYRMWVN